MLSVALHTLDGDNSQAIWSGLGVGWSSLGVGLRVGVSIGETTTWF